MLTERENILIECLVKDYISKGNAISSDRLLEKTGLKYSAATIRKDLIKLETLGLVESTHVSSGRVPTVKGYRYYIDNNLKKEAVIKIGTGINKEPYKIKFERKLYNLICNRIYF